MTKNKKSQLNTIQITTDLKKGKFHLNWETNKAAYILIFLIFSLVVIYFFINKNQDVEIVPSVKQMPHLPVTSSTSTSISNNNGIAISQGNNSTTTVNKK